MTLGQIKGLKKEISDEISGYLKGIVDLVNQKFDLGDIDVSVRTDVYELEYESCCNPIKRINYKVLINFSKEDS